MWEEENRKGTKRWGGWGEGEGGTEESKMEFENFKPGKGKESCRTQHTPATSFRSGTLKLGVGSCPELVSRTQMSQPAALTPP